MDAHVAAYSTIDTEMPVPRARLPGEPDGAPSHPHRESAGGANGGASGGDGRMAPPAIEPGDRPASSAPPQSRRRRGLLMGVGLVALAAAGGGTFLISPYNHLYPVPLMASAVRHAAASAGIRIPPGIVAPSATLANVSVPPREPVVRAPYTPPPRSQEIDELLALHGGGPGLDTHPSPVPAAPAPPARAAVPQDSLTRADRPYKLPAAPAPRIARPSPPDRLDLAGPPPGYVPREPGAPSPEPTPAIAIPVSSPPAPAAAAGPPSGAPALPLTPVGQLADRGSAGAGPLPPPSDLAHGDLASQPPTVAAPAIDTSAGAVPPAAGPAPLPSASSAKPALESSKAAADVVAVARELHAAPMTPKDQVAVLGMVTELATMVGDLRAETREMRADIRRSSADGAAHLGDLERRMAMVEARDALSNARDAGAATPAASPAPAPVAAAPVSAAPVKLTRAAAALPDPSPGTLVRYKVQAASPGLAMLAQVDRGGGDGAQIEVRVGDSIPGWGRVRSIAQKGASWVVTTEHGDIS